MKRCLQVVTAVAVLCGACPRLFAQQAEPFENLEFTKKTDFKAQEPRILEMANYVLSRPISQDHNDKVALANIVKWMSGTPDHDFIIDKPVMDLAKDNDHVLGLYMAAAAKAALDGNVKDANQLKLNSFEILLAYCGNAANGVKPNKEMRRALAAKESGTLRQYLKL